ncbi:MAG: putative transcriptional regulator [Pseudonocardiales bacterium]|nr:putative transcriptional regulator [Pseudonocardiales bacterium]
MATDDGPPAEGAARRGRPPVTSARQLELISLRLFTEQGFEETTIEQIACAAGVNRRTFFNYFPSKTAVLWYRFDDELNAIRAGLAEVGAGVAMMDAIRQVVVDVSRYRAEDVPELRARMNLIVSVPALQESAATHYEAWEQTISEFAAGRIGQPPDSLFALAIGRTTMAAARAAYDRWVARADADLPVYLDAALAALATGFAPQTLKEPAEPVRPRARRARPRA